jgi:hypothetical protein
MTAPVGQVRRTTGVEFDAVHAHGEVSEGAPDVALPTIEGAASEAEVRAALGQISARLASVAPELSDPETAIMAVASMLESCGVESNRTQADGARSVRQTHLQKQAEAAKKAAENEKTAAFWGMFAKIASYVAAAVGAVVAIASCVVTGPGGVAGAAAIIAAVASGVGLIGQGTADVLREVVSNNPGLASGVGGGFAIAASVLGVIASALSLASNPLNALNVGLNIGGIVGQVVGGVQQSLQLAQVELPPWLSMTMLALGAAGAGLGAAGVASAARAAGGATRAAVDAGGQAARTAVTVGRVTQGAAQVTAGASEVVSAGHSYGASNDRIEARTHGQGARRAMEVISELVDDLRELAQSISRQRGRALDIGQQRSESNSSLVRNMVRA